MPNNTNPDPRVPTATTYTKDYVSAPFGTESPLELVTLKSGEVEIAKIPAALLQEMAADLTPNLAQLQTGRPTTYDERATWGTCPVCQAAPGEWCHAEVGLQLGTPAGGGKMQTGSGAHLARLQPAPDHIKLVRNSPKIGK